MSAPPSERGGQERNTTAGGLAANEIHDILRKRRFKSLPDKAEIGDIAEAFGRKLEEAAFAGAHLPIIRSRDAEVERRADPLRSCVRSSELGEIVARRGCWSGCCRLPRALQ